MAQNPNIEVEGGPPCHPRSLVGLQYVLRVHFGQSRYLLCWVGFGLRSQAGHGLVYSYSGYILGIDLLQGIVY